MKAELHSKVMVLALTLGILLLMVTCGTSGPAASTSKTTPSVSVSIVPSTATLTKGETLSFVAVVKGTSDAMVRWSVQEGTTGGSITSSGVYTAPSTLGTCHVVGASVGDESATATAVVKIVAEAHGAFTTVGSMATARADHTATLLSSGKVLIAGGRGTNFQPLAEAELYDPSVRKFAPTGSMITPRYRQSGTLLADGRVLIAGGTQDVNRVPVFTAEIYDLSTGAFTATGDMSSIGGAVSVLSGPVTALLPDGKVFVAATNNAEVYDPQRGTFVLIGPYVHASPVSVITVTLLDNGKVLVTGCSGDPCSAGMTEPFDPQTGTFGVTAPMPGTSWLEVNTATLLTNGNVLFIGNEENDGIPANAELYDPAAGTFTSVGNAIEPHDFAAAVRLIDGTVLITGSQLPGGNGGSSTELYSPATATFQYVGGMTVGRHSHRSTLLPDGTVLITGGNSYWPGSTSTAEVYKPASSGLP
jgi:hypothetical protein